jgi:hypothetical protein
MDHGPGTGEGAGRMGVGRGRDSRRSLPTPLVGSMDRHVRSWRENPAPHWLHRPLPADPIPEGSQRVGMGPRDQARRLPLDGPEGWPSGQAIHPTGLRLVRQVSLDSRGIAIPSGPLLVFDGQVIPCCKLFILDFQQSPWSIMKVSEAA